MPQYLGHYNVQAWRNVLIPVVKGDIDPLGTRLKHGTDGENGLANDELTNDCLYKPKTV